MPKIRDALRMLKERRLSVMLLLGFASGLPLALTGGTLQVWLADEGVDVAKLAAMSFVPWLPDTSYFHGIGDIQIIDLTMIALFGLVGLPYTIKMLWAPLMDRFVPPILSRRRGWLLVSQLALIVGIVAMGLTSPSSAPLLMAALAVFVAFTSASQDIAFDAYRTDVLLPIERGPGSSLMFMGYRLAMVVSGGLCIALGGLVGWRAAYLTMAPFMIIGVVGTYLAPPPITPAPPPRSLGRAIIQPFVEFLKRKHALWLLLFIIIYKLGDTLASSLFMAFLRRELEFTPEEIGIAYKTVALIAVLVGIAVGGMLMVWLGLFRSLLVFGILQAATNIVFMALAEAGHDFPLMLISVAAENVAGGMGTAAFLAFLMALCDHRFTATQYALLSSLMAIGRTLIGPVAGPMVESIGWTQFFLVTMVVAIPGLVLLWALRRPIEALDETPDVGHAETAQA